MKKQQLSVPKRTLQDVLFTRLSRTHSAPVTLTQRSPECNTEDKTCLLQV